MHRYGWMPYRDFFKTSMPGSFLFHQAIVSAFGTGNLAFIFVDDCLLMFLLAVSYCGCVSYPSPPRRYSCAYVRASRAFLARASQLTLTYFS